MESSKHKKTDTNCDMPQLSIDQLFEILSWMSAKEVIKFSSLSKSTFKFPSLPSFVERHMIHSSVIDGGCFLQPDHHRSRSSPEPTFHVLPGGSTPACIPLESLSFVRKTSRVLASSQGLLLLRKMEDYPDIKKTKNFFLCNPVTRSYVALPFPEWLESRECVLYGSILECHPRSLINTNCMDHPKFDDYRVVIIVREGSDRQLAVYSKGKWEVHSLNLPMEGRKLALRTPVCLFRGGIVFHYMGWASSVEEEPYLVAYDVGTKAFSRTFKLPEGSWEGRHCLKIFKWKRSSYGGSDTIGLVRIHSRSAREFMLTVWMLEDYERGSWRRVVQQTVADMGAPEKRRSLVCFEPRRSLVGKGSCAINGTGLMFATRSRVYLYHMEGAHAGGLELVEEHAYDKDATFVPYASTLRPVYAGESQVVTF